MTSFSSPSPGPKQDTGGDARGAGRKPVLTSAVRHFPVPDVRGRVYLRYCGVVEDFTQPQVVVDRCPHQHRTLGFAQHCADKMLKARQA